MLLSVSLQNYALAEAVDVNFEAGFNVITGETGAGKSLILDALSLCLGGRADVNTVRHGAKKAEIHISFDVSHMPIFTQWFTEKALDIEDQVLIRRQIMANGRSKAWLNGHPMSLTELKEIGAYLVQLHSQHAQTQLLKASYIVNWFDALAKTQQLKTTMQDAWQVYKKLSQQQAQAQAQSAERQSQLQLLDVQINDVAEVLQVPYDSIESEHETLSHYEQLMQQASGLLQLLDEDETSINDMLAQATRLAEEAQTHNQNFATVNEHLHTAMAEVSEAVQILRQFSDQEPPDADRLTQLDQLLSEYHRLARKYMVKPDELAQQMQTWQQEVDDLSALADPEQIAEQVADAYDAFLVSAQALDEARKKHAPKIAKQLVKALKPLALENVSCAFDFARLETPNAQGISEMQLLFSANKGMPMLPVQKQASGGELSRLALVMQVLNASKQQQALLVFDEVDVGLSGATAEIIGQLLQKLGKKQQILAITHQAQVAAQAHHHLFVTKHHDREQTFSHISNITDDNRIAELARMVGGVDITDTTLAHARSLLASAHQKNTDK